jgi:hypothetical protein
VFGHDTRTLNAATNHNVTIGGGGSHEYAMRDQWDTSKCWPAITAAKMRYCLTVLRYS